MGLPMSLLRFAALSIALFVVLGLSSGCTEEKKVSAVETDAGAPPKAMLDGKLGEAVKAAESAHAAPDARGQDGGPPDKGVFASGAADKVLALGAPPKVEVVSDGAEPKALLVFAPADAEQHSTVSIMLRNQGRGMPIDFALAVKIDKPKDKKSKDDKDADATPPAGARVLATVTGIGLPPQMPREAIEQYAKLKGSEIRYDLAPSGAVSGVAIVAPKGADPGLEQSLHQVVEGIGLTTPVLPSKPIGVGAYWMSTERLTFTIVEVMRYRVFRVEKLEGGRATLSVDIRQYAAKDDLDAGQGQRLALTQFESLGKGKIDWSSTVLLPHGEGQVRMALDGRIPTGQQAGLQAELSVKVK